jgi:hypothetical protein
MRKLLGRLLKPLIPLLLIALTPAICSCSAEMLVFLSSDIDFGSLDFFLIGLACYVLLYGAILYTGGQLRSHLQFIRLLRHELAHAVTTMLFGGRVREMLVVNPVENPGVDSYVDPRGLSSLLGPLVYLSPYYLPIFTIPLLPVRFLVSSWGRELIDFLIGFTLAFHYVSLIDELLRRRFGLGQTDVRRTGVILSYVVIGLFNLFSLATIKAVLHEQWPDVADHFSEFFNRSLGVYTSIYAFILEQLSALGLPPGG